jgi:hypothetical protein
VSSPSVRFGGFPGQRESVCVLTKFIQADEPPRPLDSERRSVMTSPPPALCALKAGPHALLLCVHADIVVSASPSSDISTAAQPGPGISTAGFDALKARPQCAQRLLLCVYADIMQISWCPSRKAVTSPRPLTVTGSPGRAGSTSSPSPLPPCATVHQSHAVRTSNAVRSGTCRSLH